MHELYIEIYEKISKTTNNILGEYVNDEDKSYQSAMALLMMSMKMFMFAGFTKDELPELYTNIEKTFNSVYKDFQRVDLNLKD